MTEKEVEKYLVKRIKELDGIAYKFVSPGNDGVPDRLCVLPYGIIQFVEVKRPGGKTSDIQDMQIRRLKKLWHDTEIVSCFEDVDNLIHELAHLLTAERIKYENLSTL